MDNHKKRALLAAAGLVALLGGVYQLVHDEPHDRTAGDVEKKTPATEVIEVNPRSPSGTSLSDGSPNRVSPPVKIAVESISGCFTKNFRHKVTNGHRDRESCAHHQNIVSLDPAATSVCVRIDGSPVGFERIKSHLLVGPLAGPASVVSVSYCIGKVSCNDNCVIPKDAFMNAIGAGEDVEPAPSAALAKWDPSDTEDNVDVTKELDAELQEDDPAENRELVIFKDWIETAKQPGCSTKLVSSLW